jgi:chromosomal replication initiation ATPase DnaA
MKSKVFKQISSKVMEAFDLDVETMSSDRRRSSVEARQMLYYIARRRNIRLVDIQDLMNDVFGVRPSHTSVIHGIKTTEKKVREDNDFHVVASRINQSVTI